MSVFLLFVLIALIGLSAWLLTTYVPMPQAIKTVIIVLAVIIAVIIALNALGVHLPNPSVPQIR